MNAAVVADDLRKRYGDTVAVDGVSLRVGEGEVFGLIGPNGAGKTTLVRCLTGTTDYEGSASVFGADPRDVARSRVGLLPQSFSPPERLTARELLSYYAGLYDDSRAPAAVLEDVGLADDADTWYEKLSGGQQRRACVAITLVNDPDVLFLDEPTTGIDPSGRRGLWRVVERLADAGTTVVLTSHSMEEVERLSDRVALLADGRVVATGTPEDLIEQHGGHPRLVVQTDTDTEALLELGYRVEERDDEVLLHGIGATDIADVVEALEEAGVDYESFTWTEPTLEEVYLELTGRRFGSERSRSRVVAEDGGRPERGGGRDGGRPERGGGRDGGRPERGGGRDEGRPARGGEGAEQ